MTFRRNEKMAKFVKCHAEGEEFLVNLDLVVAAISKNGHASLLFQDDSAQLVDESYEDMKKIIATAQGGLPMDVSQVY